MVFFFFLTKRDQDMYILELLWATKKKVCPTCSNSSSPRLCHLIDWDSDAQHPPSRCGKSYQTRAGTVLLLPKCTFLH